MKLLITGICGFVGSTLARALPERLAGLTITGIDNLSRPGAERNRAALHKSGISLRHGDLRAASDLEALPAADWVIDAAANPSVLAGTDGHATSRQLMENNLWGAVNVLEYCRRTGAGLALLGSSRVYSISVLAGLPMRAAGVRFELESGRSLPPGVGPEGISESCSTAAPVSLYGATKLAAETLALEYGAAFGFPVWVNRCGSLAGAGQFGTAAQGIFSYWLHAHAARRPLRYTGFDGSGRQVRDVLHPDDLADLIASQIRRSAGGPVPAVFNAGGGLRNSISVAELTARADHAFGPFAPQPDPRPRPFDAPWVVMDSALARRHFAWEPRKSLDSILDEIVRHARDNPDWLEYCGV